MPTEQNQQDALPTPSDALLGQNSAARVTPNPLPKAQLAAVYAIKLVVPIAIQQVTPYVNQMIGDLHLSDAKSTGYYSGLVGGALTLAQLLSVYPWSLLSDRIGRIPVIVVGTLGIGTFTLLFGLSQTYTSILLSRFLVGLCCGIVGSLNSVVGELSDATNASTAFPFYDAITAIGYMVGPLIGGTLAQPAKQHPSWPDVPPLRTYPYLLPCLLTSILSLIAAGLAAFYLLETNKRPEPLPSEASTSSGPATEHQPAHTALSLWAIPELRLACFASGAIGFLASAFNNALPLAAYTPESSGGWGLSPSRTAYALSLMGFISVLLKLALPVVLQRRLVEMVFVACTSVWPIVFALFPVLTFVSQATNSDNQSYPPHLVAPLYIFLTIFFALLLMSRVGTLTFGMIMILIKERTPTSSALGAANGLSETIQMIGILVGAVFVSSLYAFSITYQIFGGALWVIVMILLSVGILVYLNRELPRGRRGAVRLD